MYWFYFCVSKIGYSIGIRIDAYEKTPHTSNIYRLNANYYGRYHLRVELVLNRFK